MPRKRVTTEAVAFIQSLPQGLPASHVVKLAAQRKLSITEKQVWNTRARGKPAPVTTEASAADAAFMAAATRVGVDRAQALLQQLLAQYAGASSN